MREKAIHKAHECLILLANKSIYIQSTFAFNNFNPNQFDVDCNIKIGRI